MRTAALLLGAGRGDRLGIGRPKAFVELEGKTLLRRAVETVEACPDVAAFVVAAPAGWEDRAEALAGVAPKLTAVVAGGATRQRSVVAALGAVPDEVDAIITHDVARPLASAKLFSAVLEALQRADGAIPVLPVPDTVKRVRGETVVETIDRSSLVLAQTPQAFRSVALTAAHHRAAEAAVEATDDAVLVQAAGFRVIAIPGDPENVKITVGSDLRAAEALLLD
jgi:2-C-methyl-D-erythritol 4-phosphate cytidylyltransferase / 2-C-methyl-D-erythritol 2,4-cyclodiphosphate synthase